VDAAGVAALVFFTNRFRPEIEEFLADLGRTGDWYALPRRHARVDLPARQPVRRLGMAAPARRPVDIGPHALSILLPVLGDVTEVTAVDGPRETVNVIARHADGAASDLSLTLNAAPNAVAWSRSSTASTGSAVVPGGDATDPVRAFGHAVDRLIAMVAGGERRDPRDVHFGRTSCGSSPPPRWPRAGTRARRRRAVGPAVLAELRLRTVDAAPVDDQMSTFSL
jgi:hypothetical protein